MERWESESLLGVGGSPPPPALSIKRRVRRTRGQDPRRAPVSDGMVREGRLKLQSLERSGSSTLQLVRIAKEDRELKEELGETRQQTALRLAHCSEREERLKARREDLRIRRAANEDFLKVVDSKVGKAEKKRQVEERECRGLDGEIIELKKREAELIEMKRMVEEEVRRCSPYREYLERVVAFQQRRVSLTGLPSLKAHHGPRPSLRPSSSSSGIGELLRRYKLLCENHEELSKGAKRKAERVEGKQEALKRLQRDAHDEEMALTSELYDAQVKLDACQLTRGELEEKMQRARHEQERKAAALDEAYRALKQLLSRLVATCRLRGRAMAMMEMVDGKNVEEDGRGSRLDSLVQVIIERMQEVEYILETARAHLGDGADEGPVGRYHGGAHGRGDLEARVEIVEGEVVAEDASYRTGSTSRHTTTHKSNT